MSKRKPWRALVLVTDAFGGHGGISRFNRDFLVALSSHPDCGAVVSYPRLLPYPIHETLPNQLRFDTRGVGNKFKYMSTVFSDFMRDQQYDFIICAHINMLPLGILLAKIAKKSVVLIIHGIDAWEPNKSFLVNSLVSRVSRVVTASELTRSRFLSWSHVPLSRTTVLPNCVDLKTFAPGPRPPYLLDRYKVRGKTTILTLGRLVSKERQKGFDEVIEALPRLAKQIPDITYMIAGHGPDRARLEKKASILGVADRVVFAGMVPDSEKADHYRLADAFVMPSRGEGFGIVLLEAMACGIPTMASILDGGREALRNGLLGTLVDPRDPQDVERGMLESLKKPKGIMEGLEYFSSESYERRVHNLIEDILN